MGRVKGGVYGKERARYANELKLYNSVWGGIYILYTFGNVEVESGTLLTLFMPLNVDA